MECASYFDFCRLCLPQGSRILFFGVEFQLDIILRPAMSDKPSVITIRCQGCKRTYSPKQIVSVRGVCTDCRDANWHIQAEYRVYETKSAGPLGSDGTALSNIGLNALGLGLLAATGTGFVGSVGDTSFARTKATGATSVADIYDVAGSDLLALCEPIKTAMSQLADFVYQKELEIQRNRMLERGGSHCRSCQILFVPSPSKPWTMVGTCSRSCCAALHGESDYSLVKEAVNEASSKATSNNELGSQDKTHMQVQCKCGMMVQLAKMYQGTYRKCPGCHNKILVPLGG